jgi:hypothetical protein
MMAEAWGRPPWEIEEQTPVVWADRYVEYHNAIEKSKPKPRASAGRRVV